MTADFFITFTSRLLGRQNGRQQCDGDEHHGLPRLSRGQAGHGQGGGLSWSPGDLRPGTSIRRSYIVHKKFVNCVHTVFMYIACPFYVHSMSGPFYVHSMSILHIVCTHVMTC